MPRNSLGRAGAEGESRRLEVKYTDRERAAVESVLKADETLSAFTREAWDYLVRKRRRDAKKLDAKKATE